MNSTLVRSFTLESEVFMRGIKIDPIARTITEVDVKSPNSSLQSLYELIGCNLVEIVQIDREMVLVCDEEGKLKTIEGAFTFYGSDLVIAGTAIILGDRDGRFKALPENIESFKIITQWVDPADVPEPTFKVCFFED